MTDDEVAELLLEEAEMLDQLAREAEDDLTPMPVCLERSYLSGVAQAYAIAAGRLRSALDRWREARPGLDS